MSVTYPLLSCLLPAHPQWTTEVSIWLSKTSETTLVTEDKDPVLLTARNDGLINNFNPVQLSAWRANVDVCHVVRSLRTVQSTR